MNSEDELVGVGDDKERGGWGRGCRSRLPTAWSCSAHTTKRDGTNTSCQTSTYVDLCPCLTHLQMRDNQPGYQFRHKKIQAVSLLPRRCQVNNHLPAVSLEDIFNPLALGHPDGNHGAASMTKTWRPVFQPTHSGPDAGGGCQTMHHSRYSSYGSAAPGDEGMDISNPSTSSNPSLRYMPTASSVASR